MRGMGSDVVEIANTARAAERREVRFARAQADGNDRSATGAAKAFAPLDTIATERWRLLSDNAIEPNGFYLPEWELAVNASAQARTDVSALTATADATAGNDTQRLIGLLPAISAWRAYGLPVPALVSADPYGVLGTRAARSRAGRGGRR